MEIAFWLIVASALTFAILANEYRHMNKKIEKDLKGYLGDILVLRDTSEPPQKVHFEAEVVRIKSLIRKHFTL